MNRLVYNPLLYSGFEREGGTGSGTPGPAGPPGAVGAVGADGAEGEQGADGFPGATGPQGPAGASGTSGANGSPGLAGVPGLDGLDGEDGLPGISGATGATGAAGTAGAAGAQGFAGMPGFDGQEGQDGFDALIPGPAGPRGLTGLPGMPGMPGMDGDLSGVDDLVSMLGIFNDYGQFFVRNGRPGGQQAYGGTNAADHLDLNANTLGFVQANSGRIRVKERMVWSDTWTMTAAEGAGASGIITATGIINLVGDTNIFAGLNYAPTINYSVAQTVSLCPAFWGHPNIVPHGALVDVLTSWVGFLSQPTYNPDTNGATTGTVGGYYAAPSINSKTSNTATAARLIGYDCWPGVFGAAEVYQAGTATLMAGLAVGNPTLIGTGAITVLCGIDMAGLTVGGTNISMRSAGGEMRHAGAAIFGVSSSGPDTTGGAVAEFERVHTLAAGLTDGFAAAYRSDPGYSGAFTVTRHNYWDVQNVSVAASAAVTDAAVMRFDAAVGTHKALAAAGAVAVTLGLGPTGATAGNPQGWLKINVNGALRYVPFW